MAQFGNTTTYTSPTIFEFCEFEPTTPWDRYNGVYGHSFIIKRSLIRKTVDGLGLYNQGAQPINVEMAGCWVGYLSWYDDDYTLDPNGVAFPSGRANGHSDGTGTHNDGVQHGSGTVTNVHGCFFQGARFNARNPTNIVLSSNGMDFTISGGNGVTPLDDAATYGAPQQGNAYLAKADAYYNVGNITFNNNWVWNMNHGISLQSGGNLFAGGYALINNVSINNNIFGGKWRNYGGSQLYYPLRYDTNCTVNGIRRTTTGPFTDTWGNVWHSGANPGVNYGDGTPVAGSAVRHRVDVVPAP